MVGMHNKEGRCEQESRIKVGPPMSNDYNNSNALLDIDCSSMDTSNKTKMMAT